VRILVAEDDVTNQKIALSLLQKSGHTVTVAVNGIEAVGAFMTQEFDLILMDIQMPEMDGFEATRLIREEERRRGTRVPIIACTAFALTGYRELCFEAGMDGYLTVPVKPQLLMETIAYYGAK
jgi:two-component system, sensor histidine kinase and response regulator